MLLKTQGVVSAIYCYIMLYYVLYVKHEVIIIGETPFSVIEKVWISLRNQFDIIKTLSNTMHMYCILTLRLASIKRSHSNSNIPCITASLNTSGIFFVRSWKENNTGKITIHVHVTWKKIINSIWENSKHKQDMKPKTKCRFSEYSVQKDYLNDKSITSAQNLALWKLTSLSNP